MTFSRWAVLIGLVLTLGAIEVFQQTTSRLKAYELGQRYTKLHELENDTLWLKAKVVGMQSPAHLAKTMTRERLNLVAWSELPSVMKTAQLAKASEAWLRDRLAD